jgi:hypothetical protein
MCVAAAYDHPTQHDEKPLYGSSVNPFTHPPDLKDNDIFSFRI